MTLYCTSNKVVHPSSEGYSRISNLCSPDLGALHSHQDQHRSKKGQNYRDDDKSSAHVDIPCPKATKGRSGQCALTQLPLSCLTQKEKYFTYSSGRALKECPCSQILLWNQRHSPSTGWRSSWKWSGLCCPPQTKSKFLLPEWNKPESIQPHRPLSSKFLCTSPRSCTPYLPHSYISNQTNVFRCSQSQSHTWSALPWTQVHIGFVYDITCFALNCV